MDHLEHLILMTFSPSKRSLTSHGFCPPSVFDCNRVQVRGGSLSRAFLAFSTRPGHPPAGQRKRVRSSYGTRQRIHEECFDSAQRVVIFASSIERSLTESSRIAFRGCHQPNSWRLASAAFGRVRVRPPWSLGQRYENHRPCLPQGPLLRKQF